ncbi:glycosyltransferase family 4 protein [Algoriphagus formosus]|uniref:glycosyltransferase family 4 protein n=1 Tax=Algoriphagus formosus TaxID=2007308 RepID=UPI000C28AC9D|nr:glycosyltransferase family 4 protein [Algoriphagus formosus]
MKKRVLIITYYWPPSGGSGVQRWLKFAKYLPEFDWEPVIFTPENPDFDIQDASLEKEISKDLEVIKFPIWEPYSLLAKLRGKKKSHPARIQEQKDHTFLEKIAIWARANLLVPDPRKFWIKPSVKFLLEAVQSGHYQAIITTGPPHSMHLIGKQLKEKTGVFWVADFRDPWSEWEFLDTLPMSSAVRRKHQKLEKAVLTLADHVLTISPSFQADLERIAGRKIDLLTNGFDSDDLPADFKPKKFHTGQLHLVYTGVIDSIRDPRPILNAFREEFSQTGQNVKFTFVGKVSEQVREFVKNDPWLIDQVHFPGYVSHAEVFDYYAQADTLVLILTTTKNAKGNIPGKLFEYLSTSIPILALGDPEGDTAKILKESKGGRVVASEDEQGIRSSLKSLSSGQFSRSNPEEIIHFSRKNLSKQLAEILDESTLS